METVNDRPLAGVPPAYEIANEKALDKCDAALLARIKDLKESDVKAQIGRWLDSGQIRALMARKKLIVKHFETGGPAKLDSFLPSQR